MVILVFHLYIRNKAYIQMEFLENFRGLGWEKGNDVKTKFKFSSGSWPAGHPAI